MPKLTVMMPALHAATTIRSSIRSTLRAMPRDAELVVMIDGPDEATEQAARRIRDRRLVVRPRPVNRGVVACLREMLVTTDSDFVARMDADDISLPWRFRLEMPALKHADLVCGTGIRFGRGVLPRPSYPGSLTSQEIGVLLPFVNPLFHPSLLARRETLLAAHAYAVPSVAEDYVLWLDALAGGARLTKTAAPVIGYRLGPGQITGAEDYLGRVRADLEVRRACTAWVEASGKSWLLEHGGTPLAPVLTEAQLEAILAQVRWRTRHYVRHQISAAATILTAP